jgi:hypothetical protein
MSYMHIENLYKAQEIFMFKECFAMEKIHGTSSHVSFNAGEVKFFSGGCSNLEFVKLFNKDVLQEKLKSMTESTVFVYGEAYGGKLMGMSATYGKGLRFVAFEVKIGDCWLNVSKAHAFCESLGLDFVPYVKIPCTLEAIDAERDKPSVQAVKLGMGSHLREGIVLRPIEEFTMNNGSRVIAKHKRDEFMETSTPRKVVDPDQLQVLSDAKAIADEWATLERLNHVLDGNSIELRIENTGKVIKLMCEDIFREAGIEVRGSQVADREIGRATALMFKEKLKSQLKES